MSVFHQDNYPRVETIFGSLILAGPLAYGLLPDPFLSHEFWAGTLIALSLGAYARGWYSVSVISGLMALSIRELSLPFICIMLVFSWMEGRRREALVWLMVIVSFVSGFFLHWSVVSQLITENDLDPQGGWLAFSGWPFILGTAQTNPYLLLAPSWITAIVLPFALLGLAGWRGKLGSRVATTVGLYILVFLCVGRPLNRYWGLMYSFLMPIGLLHAPPALKNLWLSISRSIRKKGG
jgi:hypothetical protein